MDLEEELDLDFGDIPDIDIEIPDIDATLSDVTFDYFGITDEKTILEQDYLMLNGAIWEDETGKTSIKLIKCSEYDYSIEIEDETYLETDEEEKARLIFMTLREHLREYYEKGAEHG